MDINIIWIFKLINLNTMRNFANLFRKLPTIRFFVLKYSFSVYFIDIFGSISIYKEFICCSSLYVYILSILLNVVLTEEQHSICHFIENKRNLSPYINVPLDPRTMSILSIAKSIVKKWNSICTNKKKHLNLRRTTFSLGVEIESMRLIGFSETHSETYYMS